MPGVVVVGEGGQVTGAQVCEVQGGRTSGPNAPAVREPLRSACILFRFMLFSRKD